LAFPALAGAMMPQQFPREKQQTCSRLAIRQEAFGNEIKMAIGEVEKPPIYKEPMKTAVGIPRVKLLSTAKVRNLQR